MTRTSFCPVLVGSYAATTYVGDQSPRKADEKVVYDRVTEDEEFFAHCCSFCWRKRKIVFEKRDNCRGMESNTSAV